MVLYNKMNVNAFQSYRFAALGQKYEKPKAEAPRLDSTADSEERERLTFFYHPDQLNSTNFVTDIDGNATQFISYIPYGEVFVEERNSSFSSSYLFNAKELDNETGLYYYGARYLDPEKASWLSVDPLWEKYPGISPYSYCVGNPVRLVDLDGRDWYDTGEGKFEWYDTDKKWTEFGSRVGRDFETYDEDGNLWYYGGNGQCSQVEQVLPEFVVEGKEKSFSDRVVEFAERADCYADEYGPSVAKGTLLLNPAFSFFNSSKTLVTGTDIYDNPADPLDHFLSILDIVTLGISSSSLKVGKLSLSLVDDVSFLGSVVSTLKTIATEYGKKEEQD